MKITLNNCFASFKDEKSAANHKLTPLHGRAAWFAFLIFFLVQQGIAVASVDYAALPTATLMPVQKNENGNKYKIGARIPLMVPLPKELINPGTMHFSINVPEGSSEPEAQGWYLDPEISISNGNIQMVVSPIQAGQLTLPQLIISKLVDDSTTPIERTEPWVIEVEAPTPDPKTATEYVSPIDISLTTRVWMTLVLGCLLGFGLTLYALRKYLNVKPVLSLQPIIPVTPESESIIAFQKLRALFAENNFSIKNLKPIAFGTSDIMKEYLSARFEIDAQEATTSELFSLLIKSGVPQSDLKDIENLYRDLDLIKFTKPESYTHFNEDSYLSIRIRAEALVARWGTKK